MTQRYLQEPKKLGIVGLGEVCLERVIPALNSNLGYEIVWIVSSQPKDQALKELARAEAVHSKDLTYHQNSGSLTELPEGAVAVLETAPSIHRANIAELVLAQGLHLYAEKPTAINHEDLNRITLAVSQNPNLLAYLVEYYRDGKNGLALRAALSHDEPMAIRHGSWYKRFFDGGVIPSNLSGALKSIGKIEYILGTGIEDEGITGDLTHKLWLGDRSQGGQFLDRSTHLISLVHLLGDQVGEVAVESVRAGICTKFDTVYRNAHNGETPAETYAEVTLRSQYGFPIVFGFGNYTGTVHRMFEIKGSNGFVSMDFGSQVTTIQSPIFSGSVRIGSDTKYSVIMDDFMRRLDDPDMHHEYGLKNSIQTMNTIFAARKMITPDNTFFYEAGNVPFGREIAEVMRR